MSMRFGLRRVIDAYSKVDLQAHHAPVIQTHDSKLGTNVANGIDFVLNGTAAASPSPGLRHAAGIGNIIWGAGRLIVGFFTAHPISISLTGAGSGGGASPRGEAEGARMQLSGVTSILLGASTVAAGGSVVTGEMARGAAAAAAGKDLVDLAVLAYLEHATRPTEKDAAELVAIVRKPKSEEQAAVAVGDLHLLGVNAFPTLTDAIQKAQGDELKALVKVARDLGRHVYFVNKGSPSRDYLDAAIALMQRGDAESFAMAQNLLGDGGSGYFKPTEYATASHIDGLASVAATLRARYLAGDTSVKDALDDVRRCLAKIRKESYTPVADLIASLKNPYRGIEDYGETVAEVVKFGPEAKAGLTAALVDVQKELLEGQAVSRVAKQILAAVTAPDEKEQRAIVAAALASEAGSEKQSALEDAVAFAEKGYGTIGRVVDRLQRSAEYTRRMDDASVLLGMALASINGKAA